MRVTVHPPRRHSTRSHFWLAMLATTTLSITGSSIALGQEAQPTRAIPEEVLQQAVENQARSRRLGLEGAGHRPGPVFSTSPADALGNNNGGAIGTAYFTQSETSILAFGSKVVLGFNDSGSYGGVGNHFTGFSYSVDGGATFTDGGILPASAGGDAGDPVMARNETTGRIYFSTLGFSLSTIQVFRSDDDGVTWMAPVNGTPGGSSEDKEWMVVDNYPGAGNGNVYLISRRFGTPAGIYMFRSTDHGATFGPSGGTLLVSGQQGAFVAVGPDHAVYAFWWNGATLRVRKSTDFGVSFAPAVTIASGLTGGTNGDLGLTGIRQGTVTASAFRSNSFPHAAINPANGHIYVVFNDNPAGVDKGDIFMVMSTDGGATWSPRTRVNDDVTTTDQWQPTLAVTPDGTGIGIFYYSRQEDAANNLFKFYGRTGFISGPTVTFTPSAAISSVASLPEFGRDATVNATYMSDYDFAVATPGKFHVVWSDNRDDLTVPGGAPRKDPNIYYKSIDAGLQSGPYISVAPSTVDFGSVAVTATANRVISITNIGDAPLTVSTITSPAPDFSIVTPSLPATIPSLGSITVTASFSPATLGAQSSSFTINSDAGNAPSVTVSLAGTGVENIRVTPLSIDFGTHAVGTTAGPSPVTITNTGTTALTVSAISAPGGSFSVTHPSLPIVLPAAGTATVNASFTPASPGPHNATFTITSDAIGAPTVNVSLSGIGIVPPPNDLCANAIPITCGSSTNGTTVLSTFDNVGTCGTSNTTGGVWYTITGTGLPITVATCAAFSYDTKISVFSGTCASRTCVGGNDDFCGLGSQVTWNSTLGTNYMVLVHGFSTQTGTFTLTVTCPPKMEVAPTSIAVTLPFNGTGSEVVNVLNTAVAGSDALSYNFSGIESTAIPATPAIDESPAALFHVSQATVDALNGAVPPTIRQSLRTIIPEPAMEKQAFVDLLLTLMTPENLETFHMQILSNSIVYPDQIKDAEPGVGALGAGGPDAFGYRWIDSDAPGGPAFSWTDITGTGTSVTLTDDSNVLVPLPFTFTFYGVNQTQVRIGSNGYLTFGPDGSTFTNANIPSTGIPNNIICPFWDDLNPALGGTIHYLGSATQFVVQYTNILHFGTTANPYTFQVILNSDGSILYQYLNMAGAVNSATVGIENPAGTIGLRVVFNAAYVHNNLAVRVALPDPCSWITSFTPGSGTVPAGGSQPVAVGLDAAGLALGTYNCQIVATGNGANTSSVVVPIQLTVVNTPPIWIPTPGAGDQSVQYSDAIVAVPLSADDDGATGQPLTATTSWTKDGGPSSAGLPPGLSFSSGGCVNHPNGSQTCSWTLSGQMLGSAGVYVISVAASDGMASSSFAVTITVTTENTTVAFGAGNPGTVQVGSPGGTASFSLASIVTEFDNPNDVLGDANMAGDINQAVVGVVLVPLAPGPNVAPVSCASVVTAGTADPDSPYDYDVRTITCSFSGVPVNVYSVVVTVNGDYYAGSGEDMVIVTDPSLGFITGGGWFYWPESGGSGSPGAGDKTNFGFNVKYKKNGRPQGELLVMRHMASGGKVRLKSTSMTGLSIGASSDGGGPFEWASFSGKGTFQSASASEPTGNHDFTVYVEDRGSPGSSDKFWVSVKNGGVVQADLSLPLPAAANAVTLGGGNIVVPHVGGSSATRVGEELELPLAFGLSHAQPSPFRGETSLKFQMPEGADARLEIYDVSGRAVARLVDGYMPAGNHHVTWKPVSIPGGVYFARFIAGSFTQTRRLLLLP